MTNTVETALGGSSLIPGRLKWPEHTCYINKITSQTFNPHSKPLYRAKDSTLLNVVTNFFTLVVKTVLSNAYMLITPEILFIETSNFTHVHL